MTFAATATASAADRIRVAVQRTGTLAWSLMSSRPMASIAKSNLEIQAMELASPEAGKIAIKGGSADLLLSDWLWVAREARLGDNLVFYPSSSTVGAVMVPAEFHDPQRGRPAWQENRDCGRPLDKSWLLLQAWRAAPISICAARPSIVYGAPPLLSEKGRAG